ncbi:MAG: hypothetical protein K5661_00010 [Bacteroidales bacterium]|nr:hypothetical protein [Bacteroidales bacterium]
MACFVVPLVQAIATSALRKWGKKDGFIGRNLASLELMLWGGTVMLIVDHVINGELTWKFPFFTALGETGGGAVMLREMLTVGLPMSIIITLVWAIYAYVKEPKLSTK